MASTFQPRTDILPRSQRRLWPELAATPPEFVLYGGTAIALHLGHRNSVDFDFFGDRAIDGQALLASIPYLSGATVTQQEPNTLSCIVDRDGPVRVSFFGVPALPRLRPFLTAPDNGLRIASLVDLAGTKASVVQVRAEAKDYIDLDAILTDGRVDLPTALSAARAQYGISFSPLATLKALTYFGDETLADLPGTLCARLIEAVRKIDLDRLPGIEVQ